MEDLDCFSSKDFYISAVLIAAGCSLRKLEPSNGDLVEFVFGESPEDCHGIIAAYWADELMVNPRKMVEAINMLKSRLHQRI